jgi:hypothetical protein
MKMGVHFVHLALPLLTAVRSLAVPSTCTFSTPAGDFDLAQTGSLLYLDPTTSWSYAASPCANTEGRFIHSSCPASAPAFQVTAGECLRLGTLASRAAAPLQPALGVSLSFTGGDGGRATLLELACFDGPTVIDALVTDRAPLTYVLQARGRAGCPLACARDAATGAVCGGEGRGACSLSATGGAKCECLAGFSGAGCNPTGAPGGAQLWRAGDATTSLSTVALAVAAFGLAALLWGRRSTLAGCAKEPCTASARAWAWAVLCLLLAALLVAAWLLPPAATFLPALVPSRLAACVQRPALAFVILSRGGIAGVQERSMYRSTVLATLRNVSKQLGVRTEYRFYVQDEGPSAISYAEPDVVAINGAGQTDLFTRTHAGMCWAEALRPLLFFKADTDSFVRFDIVLPEFLAGAVPSSRLYWGREVGYGKPAGWDMGCRWDNVQGACPRYMAGLGYAISGDLLPFVCTLNSSDFLHGDGYTEDAAVGVALSPLRLHRKDDHRFHDVFNQHVSMVAPIGEDSVVIHHLDNRGFANAYSRFGVRVLTKLRIASELLPFLCAAPAE